MKKLSLLVCLFFILVGCSSNNIENSNNNLSNSQNSGEQYVTARRVFDYCYETLYTDYPEEDLTFDELPGATFIAEYGYYRLNIDETTVLSFNQQLYLADVNQDIYLDICYCYSRGSGIINYGVSIYDYFNKAVLFEAEDRMNHNYLFDLDDHDNLVLYELNPTTTYHSFILTEAKRFLKKNDGEILSEPFDLDYKLQGFSTNYNTERNVERGSVLRLEIALAYVHKPGIQCPVKKEDVELLNSEGRFTYSVDNYQTEVKDFVVEITPIADPQTRMDVTVVIWDYSYTITIMVV